MLRISRALVVSALLVLLAAAASLAQGPMGPPPPPPQAGQSNNQFSQMREKYKYTFQLMQMTSHIMAINKDPKYALTQAQAKKVLVVLQPLRKKPKLTQEEAKTALKKLKPIFTVKQLNAMAKIKPPRRGPGISGGGYGAPGAGQRGPGGGGPPGGRQPGMNRPRFDPNAMKDFNPFYSKVKAGDEFGARRAKRWNQFFTAMDNKAKGKKPTSIKSSKTKASSTTKSK